MFRTTHIRTKLAVALAVPMVALVAVAGFEVLDSKAEVDRAQGAGGARRDLARARQPRGEPAERAQPSRHRPDRSRRGGRARRSTPTTRRERRPIPPRSSSARRRTRTAVRSGTPSSRRGRPSRTSRTSARTSMPTTGPMDSTNEDFADEVFQRYTAIIEAFFDGTSTVVSTVDDAELRNGAEIVDATTRQSEMRARIVRSIVQATITVAASTSPPSGRRWRRCSTAGRGFDDTIRANATRPLRGRRRRDLRRGRRPELQPAGRGLPRRQRRRDHAAPDRGRVRSHDRVHGPARRRPAIC